MRPSSGKEKAIRRLFPASSIRRARQILSVFTAHGFGHLLQKGGFLRLLPLGKRRWGRKSVGERLREAFEELGPTFVKLGQLMSTRSDLLPEDITDELKKLVDRAEPIQFEMIRPIVESELGSPIEAVFDMFDPIPEAAASIAQVHRAKLRGGEEVVVKVQRPGIERIVETDILIASSLVRILEGRIPDLRKYDISGIVEEMSRWLRKELDFSIEAGYVERFQEFFRDDPNIKIPKVYKSLCGKRVLVMERISGKRLGELTEDRPRIARTLIDLFLRQIFEIGLFHADPHPGNIFITEDGAIAMIDFGQVGRIGPELKRSLARIFVSIVEADPDGLARECVRIGVARRSADIMGLKEDFADLFDRYYGKPLSSIETGRYLGEILSIIGKRGLRMPMELILLMKALVIVGDIARDLDPDLVLLDVIRPYAKRVIRIEFIPKGMGKEVLRVFGKTTDLLREMPDDISEIISRLKNGTMRFEMETTGMEDLTSKVEKAGNRISLGILATGFLISSSILLISEVGPRFLGLPVLGFIGMLLTGFIILLFIISFLR